jgi:hypothetical protein
MAGRLRLKIFAWFSRKSPGAERVSGALPEQLAPCITAPKFCTGRGGAKATDSVTAASERTRSAVSNGSASKSRPGDNHDPRGSGGAQNSGAVTTRAIPLRCEPETRSAPGLLRKEIPGFKRNRPGLKLRSSGTLPDLVASATHPGNGCDWRAASGLFVLSHLLSRCTLTPHCQTQSALMIPN